MLTTIGDGWWVGWGDRLFVLPHGRQMALFLVLCSIGMGLLGKAAQAQNGAVQDPAAERAISAIVAANQRSWRVTERETRLSTELRKTRRLVFGATVAPSPAPLPSGSAIRRHAETLEALFFEYGPARSKVSSGGRAQIARVKASGSRLTRSLRSIADASTREERSRLAKALLSELDAGDPRVQWGREHGNRPTIGAGESTPRSEGPPR